MGYRSEVLVIIQLPTEQDKDRLLDLLPKEQRALVDEHVEDQGNRLVFHVTDWKWYAKRHWAGGLESLAPNPPYTDVEAIEALVELADEQTMLWSSTDGEEGVHNIGVFIRIGEEREDVEERAWGDGNPGLPEAYELAQVSTRIDINPYGIITGLETETL